MNDSILIICTSLNMGGTEKQAVWLANSLTKRDKKVFFVSLKDAGVLSETLDAKVSVNNFKLRNASSQLSKLFYFFKGVYKLRKLIDENNIDTMVSFLIHSNIIGKILLIFNRKKMNHIIAFRSDRLSKRNSQINKFRTFIFKNFIINQESIVVFNSQSGLSNMNLKKPTNNLILNAPLNKQNLSYSNNHNKLIFVGRLDELKNVNNIILSLKYLSHTNISLDIYGKGPELPIIRKTIEDNKLSEAVTIKNIDLNISNRLNEYDALIIASTHEAFPNVIIEAMNAGIVPISTKVGDCTWLLDENRGIFIEGFDPEHIARALIEFYEMDIKKRKNIIQNCRSFIDTELNEEKILNEWIDIIYKKVG